MYSPLVLTGMIPKCTPTFSQIRRFKKKQPPKRIQKIYISNRWLMLDICHCFFVGFGIIYTFSASFFGDLLYGATVIFTGFVAENSPGILCKEHRQAMEVVSSQLMIVSTSLMSIIDNS